jgi:hypothetical protein
MCTFLLSNDVKYLLMTKNLSLVPEKSQL